MTPRKILVVGSANIDLVVRVSRIPHAGETLMGQTFTTVCGGKGANQAVAAARLGASVAFIGCIGADAFGAQQSASLSDAGVDLRYLKTANDTPTGTAIIQVSDSGENSIVVVPGANFCLTPDDVLLRRAAFEEADVVVLQLEVPVAVVEAALNLARRTETLSILDIGSDQPVPESVLGMASVVTPNASEAERLTGIRVQTQEAIRDAAARLHGFGTPHVVMKLGENGSQYFGPHENVYAPPFQISAVDTTAAGDAFTAALGVGWSSGDIGRVLRYANAAGALAATKAGAQPSLPMAQDVARLMDRPL